MLKDRIVNIIFDGRIYAFDLEYDYELLEEGNFAFLRECRANWSQPFDSDNPNDKTMVEFIPTIAKGDCARELWRMLCARAVEIGYAIDAGLFDDSAWELSERLAASRRKLGRLQMEMELQKNEELIAQLDAQRAIETNLVKPN
jgi:hypothetical protein